MSGAGIVLLKKDTVHSSSPLMLALVRKDGLFDVPKGHKDNNESSISTAVRECFEECSIAVKPSATVYGSFSHGPLVLFCAITDSTPSITTNPETGLLEHIDWRWIDKNEFISNCLDYLRPGVEFFYSEHSKQYNP